MTDETTQPVVEETEVQPKPAATEDNTGARNEPSDDLESFLSDYENQTRPQPAPEPQPQAPQIDPLEFADMKAELAASRAERQKREIANLISSVKGEYDGPDYVVRGWLESEAESDPRIAEIWQKGDPAQKKRLTSKLKANFASVNAKKPDREATADHEAVAAAVKGANSKAPEEPAPNYGSMNNAQFQAERDKFGV